MIHLHHISKIYHSDSVETHALSEVSLHVEEGEFISIMGPSGCGKTTLLNIIGMLDEFEQGLYVFDDREVKQAFGKGKGEASQSQYWLCISKF